MEIIRQDREDVDAVSSLVIGTEAKDILLLNPSGASVDVRCTLPSVPQMISVVGAFFFLMFFFSFSDCFFFFCLFLLDGA